MGPNQAYLNGRMVPADEAAVGVFDAGLLHGASVFSTMLAHNGAIFRLERHLARMAETVRLLELRMDVPAEELAAAARGALALNALTEARMRITLTPGSVRGGGQTTLITAEPLAECPAEWYERGIGAVIAPFRQVTGDPTFGHKTGCYLPRVLARQSAAAKGAEEALWYTADNRLAEACFCNVFVVLGGEVYTPPRDTPVLPGVVREAVIELCGRMGIACHDEQPLYVRQMLDAEEMFVTSSCSGIRPVVRVERHAVGEERPGQVARRIMAAYRELLETECPAQARGEGDAT